MNLLRLRIHHLIEQLADQELDLVWNTIYNLHCDFYILEAIQEVKRSQQPWDTLTHEEATQLLIANS
ncbi:hypothetical protein ACF3DV_00095 [Chlorogloeopsis fritschii PCC 9212]|jgi:hypothetical protein|uniref:Uncharacterized protein n=1 Tax=Chlorogloeopsis fritschii PCC 6912 TaxID=211165 RepID=A0A3S0XNQ3_CHLFR|nr:hypothetical protein [Chlorogloeopsis fritschii]RUR73509.1 hypothetical protein PCC6912_56800 [Chlorogloeopsis fritschii PCC 6912]